MGMPRLEKLVVNTPFRMLMQKAIPTPFFIKNKGGASFGICLEIGCGQGSGAKIIANTFSAVRVIALDYDLEQLQLAQKKMRSYHSNNITLLNGDASALSFASEKFEAVFDYGIVHHIPKWKQAMAEVYRVLKPGGCFFYEDITSTLLERYFFAKFFPHPQEAHFSREEFERVLTGEGFKLQAKYELCDSYLLGVARKPE